MLRLTALLGRPVVGGGGRQLGELEDLEVDLGADRPLVVAVRARADRTTVALECGHVAVAGAEIAIDEAAARRSDAAPRLLLRRHVLDAQVLDVEGRRLVRVGDVVLEHGPRGSLVLAGVEIGIGPVLRRLGVRRAKGHGGDELLDWHDLHLASAPGHVLQLRSGHTAIHRLARDELEELSALLPPPRAHELRRYLGIHRHRPPAALDERPRRGKRFGSVLRFRRRAPR